MKIYFDATPSQIDKYRENYQVIGRTIVDLGHELTTRWILDFDESFFQTPRSEWANHYRSIRCSLEKADIAILEISVSSTSVGQLIQQALIWRKPVIALKDLRREDSIFLVGAGEVESKLIVVGYSLDTLKQKLTQALEYVEDWFETRFTFIVDSRIKRHLNEVAKSGTSRSDYIRNLIEQDIDRKLK